GPAAAVGQVCQRSSRSEIAVPRPMSEFAIRTSVVSSCAMGAGAGGGGGSDRPASNAAIPPATTAMINTMIRAGFILILPTITPQPDTVSHLPHLPRPLRGRAHAQFQQLNVKAWLTSGIQMTLIIRCFARSGSRDASAAARSHVPIAVIHCVSG